MRRNFELLAVSAQNCLESTMDKIVTQMRKTDFEKSYHNINMLFLSFVTPLQHTRYPAPLGIPQGLAMCSDRYSERVKLKKKEKLSI